MGLFTAIQDGKFTINVEFTPHNAEELRHIAEIGKGLVELNKKYEEDNLVFTGVSLTQNPGGNVSYDHLGSLTILRENGWPEEIEICPHITGKDMNVDAIHSLLLALSERRVGHVLALTGDLSNMAYNVFELDSLGLLQLIREINIELLRGAGSPDAFRDVPIISAGAAISPYKHTEGSRRMQYIKGWKKIREGASFLTLQCGWNADQAEELIREFKDCDTPILGNALVVTHPVAKYMQTLPGCVVPEAMLEALQGKKLADALERAGWQVAMFKQLGYAGVDLGKPGEFKKLEHIEKVIDTALATEDWREHYDELTFKLPENPPPKVHIGAGFSKWTHKQVLDPKGPLYGFTKTCLKPFEDSVKNEGFLYRLWNGTEGLAKGVLYNCEHCGDCFLPENDYVCTIGQCEKGLDNPPCGDADPEGICGNNPERVCVGETLYYRKLHFDRLEEFQETTLPPRKSKLHGSASLLNYYYGRDHAHQRNPLEGSGLVQIAELIHASIPLPGAAMKFIKDMGEEGFWRDNRGRLYVIHLIQSQAKEGADYIDINIDALGCANAPDVMREYVKLVHHYSHGTPPCIDSSDPAVLKAGLDEWFSLGEDLRPPLVNSLPHSEKDKLDDILALREENAFSIICLLVGPTGPFQSTGEMVEAARELHERCQKAGFRNEEIFFDCVTLGIASDGCMDAMGQVKKSHTHNSFHAIRQITQDPKMKGCHAVLGVSNWVYGAKKRRIGHIRAFIAAGQKFGLDAAIVDTGKQFGVKPAAPELIKFVETYVSLDGNEDSMMAYSAAMQEARENGWI